MLCEKCGARPALLETRRNSKGDVRRRYECNNCDVRWTDWNGEAPPKGIPEPKLTDEIILDILTDKSPRHVLSVRHGCSASTVGKVRRGELYPHVHPEIPRFKSKSKIGKKTCTKCNHYTGNRENPCSLGHPDPIEEGLNFAFYCPSFSSPHFK